MIYEGYTTCKAEKLIMITGLFFKIKFVSKVSENRQRKGIGIVRNFWDTSFENSKEVFF